MRPASIVNFERFYLATLAVSVVSYIILWDETRAAVEAELPPELQFGQEFLLGSMVIGTGLTLLLWYFVARRASVVAKWLVVAFFVFTLYSLISSIAGGAATQGSTSPLGLLFSLAVVILEALAVWMLFRPDAKVWFARGKPDADVFS